MKISLKTVFKIAVILSVASLLSTFENKKDVTMMEFMNSYYSSD